MFLAKVRDIIMHQDATTMKKAILAGDHNIRQTHFQVISFIAYSILNRDCSLTNSTKSSTWMRVFGVLSGYGNRCDTSLQVVTHFLIVQLLTIQTLLVAKHHTLRWKMRKHKHELKNLALILRAKFVIWNLVGINKAAFILESGEKWWDSVFVNHDVNILVKPMHVAQQWASGILHLQS